MNEEMLEYICEQSKTNQEFALLPFSHQPDIIELYDAGLVQVEQNGDGKNFRVAATDGGYKWIEANKKAAATPVTVAPMQTVIPAGVRSGGIPGIDTPIEPTPSDPTPVVWDEPKAEPQMGGATLLGAQGIPTHPAPDMSVWAQPAPAMMATPTIHSGPTTPNWAQSAALPVSNAGMPSPDWTTQPAVAPAPQPAFNPAPSNIEIVHLAPPPARKRGEHLRRGEGINQFPFDSLEIGTAFHIPPTTEHPYPHKTRTGLIIAANKKYSEIAKDENGKGILKENSYNKTVTDANGEIQFNPDGTKITKRISHTVPVTRQLRKFAIYDVKKVPNAKHTAGAYVFRLPLEDGE